MLIIGKGRRKGRSPERDYWIPPLPVFWVFSAGLINIVQVINSDLQTGKWQLLLVFVTLVGFRIGISGKERGAQIHQLNILK